uniref:Uncharacterized protein n=1 Tax=uncultured Caudovirales phage TaxID=2100421 RepID=A0A6J5L354_9CAUD|nr:hypothetical protein UFOVP88_62 [uncultured Caudovirales phage]
MSCLQGILSVIPIFDSLVGKSSSENIEAEINESFNCCNGVDSSCCVPGISKTTEYQNLDRKVSEKARKSIESVNKK